MSGPGTTPLFVDTAAFYAFYDRNAPRHDRARAVFDGIDDGELHYRPLFTTTHVLAELATLLQRKRDRSTATAGLRRIRKSPAFTIVHPDPSEFDAACEAFGRYDDQEITLVDHLIATLAENRDIDHVFTFDRRDFRTLGVTVVPADTADG